MTPTVTDTKKIAKLIEKSLLLKRAISILERMEKPICDQIKTYFQKNKTSSGTQLTEFDCQYGGFTYSESDRKEIKPEDVKKILGEEAYNACVEMKPKIDKEKLAEYVKSHKVSAAKQKLVGLKEPKSVSLKPNFARIQVGLSVIPDDQTIITAATKLIKPTKKR